MSPFEQSSVKSCVSVDPLLIAQSDYPWINNEAATIPTFLVTLHEGSEFRFGSLIGLNKTIEKIATPVSKSDSSSTQTTLFMGLPSVLRGSPASGIIKVEKSKLTSSTLFVAARNFAFAGLVFAVHPSEGEHEPTTILRAGISSASERPRLFAVLGIKQPVKTRKRC